MPEERLVVVPGGDGSATARRLVGLMEAEFVTGKGRTGRLSRLYPDAFASPRHGRLFGLVASTGEAVAALAVRLFRIRRAGLARTGAMIGFVVTRPEDRGRGLGARLMDETAVHLRESGIDVGVLWGRRPDLYLKLGWQASDTSLLGRWQGAAGATGKVAWAKSPFAAALGRRLNRLRPAPAIERPALVYAKRPYPAERLWVATTSGGYAIIGEAAGTGYAFEVGGRPEAAPDLLASAATRWPDLRVNGSTTDPTSRHLGKTGLVAFQPNPLAMWLSLATRFRKRDAIWIPYFDRI